MKFQSKYDIGDTVTIEQLAELSGIDSKSVEWFARGNRGVCSCFDGFKRHIRTPADLWIIEKHNDKAL
ncbi:MAG: hypothetical protein RRY23_00055 [Alistipes sp.]